MMWLGITIICVLTVFGGLKLKRRWQRQRRKLERAAIEATLDAAIETVPVSKTSISTTPRSPRPSTPIPSSASIQPVTAPDSNSGVAFSPIPPGATLSEISATSEDTVAQTAMGQRYQYLEDLPEAERPEAAEQVTRDLVLQLADYHYLESLLSDQRYEEADRVTWRLLLQLMGADGRGYVELDEMEVLPVAELRNLDQLWQRYSQGHWGFSTQRQLFETVNGDYSELGKHTGWMVGGVWLQKPNTIYDLDRSPKGHLPQEIWRNLFGTFDAFGLALGVETFLMQPAFEPNDPESESEPSDD